MYCKLSNKKYPPKKRGKRKRNTHLTSLPDRTEITPHNATTVCGLFLKVQLGGGGGGGGGWCNTKGEEVKQR